METGKRFRMLNHFCVGANDIDPRMALALQNIFKANIVGLCSARIEEKIDIVSYIVRSFCHIEMTRRDKLCIHPNDLTES